MRTHASPDKLGIEHIRDYRRHLLSRGLKAKSSNPIVGALRFFNGTTLGDKALAEQNTYARPEDTLPAVLTQDQVLGFLQAERDPMMRTIFITIYAAGLRISEVIRLRTGNVNSQRGAGGPHAAVYGLGTGHEQKGRADAGSEDLTGCGADCYQRS